MDMKLFFNLMCVGWGGQKLRLMFWSLFKGKGLTEELAWDFMLVKHGIFDAGVSGQPTKIKGDNKWLDLHGNKPLWENLRSVLIVAKTKQIPPNPVYISFLHSRPNPVSRPNPPGSLCCTAPLLTSMGLMGRGTGSLPIKWKGKGNVGRWTRESTWHVHGTFCLSMSTNDSWPTKDYWILDLGPLWFFPICRKECF